MSRTMSAVEIPCCLTRRRMLGTALAAGACIGVGEVLAEEVADDGVRVRTMPLPRDPSLRLPMLGFGCADRFPQKRGAGKHSVDYEHAGRLLDLAMSRGLNWFDTGYVYHKGESERFLGRALAKYPRESYILSDKMCTWQIKKFEDAPRMFEEQLKRCNVQYFDIYMMHSIGSETQFEDVYIKKGVLNYLREEKKKGRIRHLGLSFHGKSPFLDRLLAAHPDLEVCMVMLNAMEFRWNKDAAKLAETAARHNVAVLVMEPLAGGRAAGLRGKALEKLKSMHPDDSAAKWGLRFAASEKGVIALASGMNKEAHLLENVHTFSKDFKPLSDEERKVYDEAISIYMKFKSIPCTGCRYCDPCPYGVSIPEIFAWYNEWAQADRLPADSGANDSQELRRRFLASYYNTFPPSARADRCLGCKKCLEACPQWTFRIPVEMGKITDLVAATARRYVEKGGKIR